ncbi:hypothetical protein C0992_010840, partial [Termitomyces sp. T32_za158]
MHLQSIQESKQASAMRTSPVKGKNREVFEFSNLSIHNVFKQAKDEHLHGRASPVKGKNREVSRSQNLSICNAFEQAKDKHLHGRPDIFKPDNPALHKKVAYVVFYRHKTSIFETWPAAAQQVKELPGGKKGWLQGYFSQDAAVKAWKHALANNLVTLVNNPSLNTSKCLPHSSATPLQGSALPCYKELPRQPKEVDHRGDDSTNHVPSPSSASLQLSSSHYRASISSLQSAPWELPPSTQQSALPYHQEPSRQQEAYHGDDSTNRVPSPSPPSLPTELLFPCCCLH